MPYKNTIKKKISVDPIIWKFLNGDEPELTLDLFMFRRDAEQVKAAWFEYRDEILKRYTSEYPGFRPPLWWRFEAPGFRQRLGGKGQQTKQTYDLGIPDGWFIFKDGKTQLNFDKENPPLYESEAEYLRRHGLLTPIEEKYLADYPEAFESIKLTDIFLFVED